MRPLRGERYVTGRHTDLVGIIRDVLPFLDYEQTLRLYADLLPSMGPVEEAILALNDRYFLFVEMLGRRDGLHPWLWERCREVEAEPDGHLDLWARGHYKSTLISFAGIIQEVLANPELTVGIFSLTQKIAVPFLTQIQGEFERNERLKTAFPDVLWADPRREAPAWSRDKGIVLKRASNPKEATIEAHGLIDGMPTGRHFQLLVYDDVINEKSCTNEEQVRKATEQWEMSDNLGVGDGTRKWYIGTRYSFGDTYGVMLDRRAATPRLHPATVDGTLDGEPVFLSPETWEKKKRDQRSTIAAQMLQNPLAGKENIFRVAWFRPWEVRPATLNVYIMGDPSKGRSKGSDRTAIAVVGVDGQLNKYLLDGARHRMNLTERWAMLADLVEKWTKAPGVQNVFVGWESFGMQTDAEFFRLEMERENWHFDIAELTWPRQGGNSKKDRVERLEPDFRNSNFYLPCVAFNPDANEDGGLCYWRIELPPDVKDEDAAFIAYRPARGPTRLMQATAKTQPHRLAKAIKRLDEDGQPYDVTRALMEEMRLFPFSPKDDLVDAVSRIYDMEPVGPIAFERVEERTHED